MTDDVRKLLGNEIEERMAVRFEARGLAIMTLAERRTLEREHQAATAALRVLVDRDEEVARLRTQLAEERALREATQAKYEAALEREVAFLEEMRQVARGAAVQQ